MNRNKRKALKSQKGSILVLVAIMMVALMALAALAVDVAHIYKVRNELQNVADAGALAGANYLYPATSSGPNWSQAQSKALTIVQKNIADGTMLTTAITQPGYWNITGSPSSLEATTITPGQYDLPAIKVTITKTAGQNGGAVQLFFGPIIGIKTMDVSATAVAVVGSPSSMAAGKLFPVAMSLNQYNQYWNSTTNQPLMNSSNTQPYEFQIAGQNTPGGTWTSFDTNSNSDSKIKSLMTSGNPNSMSVGENTWIVPGAKTNLYSYVPVGQDIIVPIVSDATSSGGQPIIAFGVIHVDASVGGSGKYIQVHFSTNNYKVYNSEPSGSNYGVYTTSRLVN